MITTYNILNSSFNVWIYCSRHNIPIQDVPEEALTLLMLKFPNQISVQSKYTREEEQHTDENL